ncbi:MAG: KTSC domain-containing protein [Epsilonproteobacteria bacterium]|nr:MAG: KTSC domain-containing protein [Campylobacterota bacterium]
MEMIYVESSNLQAVGFDESQNVLFVEFKHGGTYQYFGVDKSIFDGMLMADSKGKYFDQYVKRAGYSYAKS